MKTLAEKIAIMQAAERGEKIEFHHCVHHPEWTHIKNPPWDWAHFDYRVAPREMKIWVCSWKKWPTAWVTNSNPLTRHDKDDLIVLSEQTITY